MKRRVFAQAFLLGLFCDRAFAADPLPTLRETPMFADQVKSGMQRNRLYICASTSLYAVYTSAQGALKP